MLKHTNAADSRRKVTSEFVEVAVGIWHRTEKFTDTLNTIPTNKAICHCSTAVTFQKPIGWAKNFATNDFWENSLKTYRRLLVDMLEPSSNRCVPCVMMLSCSLSYFQWHKVWYAIQNIAFPCHGRSWIVWSWHYQVPPVPSTADRVLLSSLVHKDVTVAGMYAE